MVPRADIAAKATGASPSCMTPPARNVARARDPAARDRSETAVGSALASVDMTSVRHIPGIVRVVRIEDFLGVVAEREENAVRAALELQVEWKPWSAMPDFAKLEPVLRDHPSKARSARGGRYPLGTRDCGHRAFGHLHLALPIACLDRTVLRGGGIRRQQPHDLVGDVIRQCHPPRGRPVAGHARGSRAGDPCGRRRLLRPQLCR